MRKMNVINRRIETLDTNDAESEIILPLSVLAEENKTGRNRQHIILYSEKDI